MKLKGRAALVTGAGSGLGRAMALAFAREGASVSVVDVSETAAGEAAAAIRGYGSKAIAIKADVASVHEVDRMVERTLNELGRVDILVNNAGIAQVYIPTIEQPVEEWEQVMAVHLRGTYLCSRRVGQWMVKQNSGAVLNIASIVGFGGFPMRTAYGPAKAGIINLTQSLAVEWARYSIRVNCIAPGYIITPMFQQAIDEGRLNTEAIERRTPLGRLGKPEDIASAAVFLVSDDSKYITGVTLPVDGGWLAYKHL